MQQVDETVYSCRALLCTGTCKVKYILHHCSSSRDVQPFQLVNSHFQCKAVLQSGFTSITGCPRATLEHQVSSEQGKAQWPSVCLGRTGSRLLPQKYSCAAPPFSSKTGLPSCGLDNCCHSYVACETPDGFSAQHHFTPCICVHHSQFPPQPAARWEDKASGCSLRGGLLTEGFFILKREQKCFLKCKYIFINASCPKALLLPACD